MLFRKFSINCPICNIGINSNRNFRTKFYELDCYKCNLFILLDKKKKFKQLIQYNRDYALKIPDNGSLYRLETDGMFWFKTFEILSEESELIDLNKAIKIFKKYKENIIFQ